MSYVCSIVLAPLVRPKVFDDMKASCDLLIAQITGVKISHTNMVSAAHITGDSLREHWRNEGKWDYRTLAHLPTAHVAGVQINIIYIYLPSVYTYRNANTGLFYCTIFSRSRIYHFSAHDLISLRRWYDILDAEIRLPGLPHLQSRFGNHDFLQCAANFLAYRQVSACQRSLSCTQSGYW